jgi:hypothetical protein
LTILSWLLVVIPGVYYTFNAPADCKHADRCHTIWGQNSHLRTPFSLNAIVTTVYWITMLVMQAGYTWHLYSSNETFVTGAANVGSHFIFVGPRSPSHLMSPIPILIMCHRPPPPPRAPLRTLTKKNADRTRTTS